MAQRVAIVTGASRGLGRALMEGLVTAGWAVLGIARGGDVLEEAVRAAAAPAGGGRAQALPGDVADPELAARAAGLAWSLGEVELVIHAASTLGPLPLRPLLDHEDDDLRAVLEVNVVGPMRLLRAVAGGMALRGHGTLLLLSSDAAVEGYPGWGPYGASKAAADQLMRVLAAELAADGVRVLSVDPGEMDTDMHAAALPDADRSTLKDPSQVARVILDMVDDAVGAPGGARLVAADWRTA